MTDLDRSTALYRRGLGCEELFRFVNHEGFDGVMLGLPRAAWHLEFTVCRTHPVVPAPSPEDLLVLYVPDVEEWIARCASMRDAGFVEVEPFNPHWAAHGHTFADPDGYRTVLQHAEWPTGC